MKGSLLDTVRPRQRSSELEGRVRARRCSPEGSYTGIVGGPLDDQSQVVLAAGIPAISAVHKRATWSVNYSDARRSLVGYDC